ncbi:MAG: methylmalonyl-CoA epimerase [Bacteroidia bacterium]
MIGKIEHIGIAIKDSKTSVELFSKLFDSKPYKTEMVESEKVNTLFFQAGETKIELLEPTSPESVIAKFLEKKGEGVHHIAYAVTDIRSEIKRLKEAGFTFISEEPKAGADNKLIVFLHPKSTNGVLVELCQERV